MPTERSGSSRSIPNWLWPLALVLLLARVGFTWQDSKTPPSREELVRWRDFNAARAEAIAMNKPMLIDFSAAWCGPCQIMSTELFSDRNSAQLIEGATVPVRLIDREQEDGRNSALVDSLKKHFKVDGFPTLVVYDPASERFEQQSGYGGAKNTRDWIAHTAAQVRWNLKR